MARMIRRYFSETAGLLTLAAIAAAVFALRGGGGVAWLAAPVPWVAFMAYYGFIVARPPLPGNRLSWWLVGVGAAGTAASALAGPAAVAIALAGVGVIAVYLTWYSRQHAPAAVLEVGSPLPPFALTAVDGTATTSAALMTEPHVILFFRGNWCPFCMAQVKQIAAEYRQLDERGVRVALISPQRAADTEELAQRFDVPMSFYADVDGQAARALDLVQAGGTPLIFAAGTNGDTVVPTVVITRADGTVAWIHHADNHRLRPEPSVFLDVIDREGIGVARREA